MNSTHISISIEMQQQQKQRRSHSGIDKCEAVRLTQNVQVRSMAVLWRKVSARGN